MYPNLTAFFEPCLILKTTGGNFGKMWSTQDAIDFLSRIETFWCDNLPGAEHELVAMGHIDHLCWVSKLLWFITKSKQVVWTRERADPDTALVCVWCLEIWSYTCVLMSIVWNLSCDLIFFKGFDPSSWCSSIGTRQF